MPAGAYHAHCPALPVHAVDCTLYRSEEIRGHFPSITRPIGRIMAAMILLYAILPIDRII